MTKIQSTYFVASGAKQGEARRSKAKQSEAERMFSKQVGKVEQGGSKPYPTPKTTAVESGEEWRSLVEFTQAKKGYEVEQGCSKQRVAPKNLA